MSTYSSSGEWQVATATPQQPVRSPVDWIPTAITLVPGEAEQVAPQRYGRGEIVIVNTGVNPVQISNKTFNNSSNQYTTVLPGASWTLGTEGSVYAMSTLGTTIETVETINELDYVTYEPGGTTPPVSAMWPHLP